MKNVKMVQILFLLICLIGYTISSAQSDYVVTTKGDTIVGKVKYLDYGFDKKVQVTTADKKTVYPILQTTGFKMDNEIYHTVRYAQGYSYMKVIKTGYLSLYAFQPQNSREWDGSLLMKRDGQSLEVPNLGFKKNLKKFLSECGLVSDRIASGELGKAEIIQIVDAFNQCIDVNTKNQNLIGESTKVENQKKLGSWDQLETDVKKLENFSGSKDALEMISEIKSKIRKGEKVPNFLVEGLKGALKDQSSVQGSLESALREIQN